VDCQSLPRILFHFDSFLALLAISHACTLLFRLSPSIFPVLSVKNFLFFEGDSWEFLASFWSSGALVKRCFVSLSCRERKRCGELVW
jgi:hypothetical protein